MFANQIFRYLYDLLFTKSITLMKKFILFISLSFVLFGCKDTEKTQKHIPQEVKEISDGIRLKFIPDKRVGIFDVDYSTDGNLLLVKGVTDSPEAKEALLNELGKTDYRVTDSLRVIPDAMELNGKTYGVVNLSVCNLRSNADFSSEMATQGLLGMPVKVLQHSGWYRIQTPDNYIAWVHRAGIYPMTEAEYCAWNKSEKVIVTSHYGFAYSRPDLNSQTVSDVVSGNRFKYEGSQGNFYKVSYPDGKTAYLPKSMAKTEKEWRSSLRQDAGDVLQTAYTLLGVPYLWAGTSAKGMDCSGYVRTVLFLHDIIIPRDASQQAYVGEHIDILPDFSNLLPGDLLFFGRKATADQKERVVHVGFYIGNKKFIHSQGDVRINSFNSADPEYDEYNLNRLLFATRILDAIGTDKIETTLTNSYYQP